MTFQPKHHRGQDLQEGKVAKVHLLVVRTLRKVNCKFCSVCFKVGTINKAPHLAGKVKRNLEDEEDEEGFVSVKRAK
jgi:hypothetical protein